jgi:FHA domain
VSEGSPLDRHASSASELKERLAVERRGHGYLVYRDSDGKQVIVELIDSQLTVGRRDDHDVTIDWDKEVSRVHAQIEDVKGAWFLIDDGLSRNGSYVNGERVAGRRRLQDGDRLCFGSTIVGYRAADATDVDSTLGTRTDLSPIELSETQRKVLVALARPLAGSAFATPATNRVIADELFLSVDAVKAHLRVLFERFGLSELPQNQKRASLAASALLNGVIAPRDL